MQSKKNTKAKRKAQGLLVASPFLLPSLIGLLVFSMLPLVISGLISLTDWNGLDPLMDPAFLETHYIGLANYQSILTSAEFWKALTNTGKSSPRWIGKKRASAWRSSIFQKSRRKDIPGAFSATVASICMARC